jgi:hypothetical protein
MSTPVGHRFDLDDGNIVVVKGCLACESWSLIEIDRAGETVRRSAPRGSCPQCKATFAVDGWGDPGSGVEVRVDSEAENSASGSPRSARFPVLKRTQPKHVASGNEAQTDDTDHVRLAAGIYKATGRSPS